MKERPIIMQAESVRGILDGRKTQMRRIVNPQPFCPRAVIQKWEIGGRLAWRVFAGYLNTHDTKNDVRYCPHGLPGDRLWVKETFFVGEGMSYRADEEMPRSARAMGCRWKPSIFMPRLASRITLEITDVRVQRVQEISEEDALSEGIKVPKNLTQAFERGEYLSHRNRFMQLWDSINAKHGFPWASNPWVWVITFKLI